MENILKPTMSNFKDLNEGDVVTVIMGHSLDGHLLQDSGAVVTDFITREVDGEDTVIDVVVQTQDTTGEGIRDGKNYEGTRRRLLSQFEGFVIEETTQ